MFFGAGNLIFPPFLGNQAGSVTGVALAGFWITAVGLPMLGVYVSVRMKGLQNLCLPVHPLFAVGYATCIYLALGPFLGIPRTASISFTMTVEPFFTNQHLPLLRLIYAAVFFVLTYYFALTPEKFTQRLGKITTPCLIGCLVFLAAGIFLKFGNTTFTTVSTLYQKKPFLEGFVNGYETMDTLGALNLGIILLLNLKAQEITQSKQIKQMTKQAIGIAAVFFSGIYGLLALLGRYIPQGHVQNGAQILTYLAQKAYGRWGLILLAIIFLLACFNSCTCLLSCCGQYFSSVYRKVSYRNWVLIFSILGFLFSNLGLSALIQISIPILHVLYPIAIGLILFSFRRTWRFSKKWSYRIMVGVTFLVSICFVLQQYQIQIPFLDMPMQYLPFYSFGLGWSLPVFVLWICT